MQFFGRKFELEGLEDIYEKPGFQLIVLYGRRRVGKSTLIQEFIKGKRSIYFMSAEGGVKTNLKALSDAIFTGLGETEGPAFQNYEDALIYVFKKSLNERLVFVLDEFPYAARGDETLLSVLQRQIDLNKHGSNLMLILCGFSISYMTDKVLAYRSPLYGRRTGQLRIEPFDFFESLEMLKGFDPFDAAVIYGTTGGTPLYLEQFQPSKSLRVNLYREWFRPLGFFFDEPMTFLRQEVRSVKTYYDLLVNLANGGVRLSELANALDTQPGAIMPHIDTLITLGIIRKETAHGEKSNSKKTQYRFADNMFRFWFTFINQGSSQIMLKNGRTILKAAEAQLPTYMGPVFEDICRDYLQRLQRAGRCPVAFTDLDRWWGKIPLPKEKPSNPIEASDDKTPRSTEAEIDIIGAEDKNTALFAECKWKNELVPVSVLEKLDELSRSQFRYENRHLFIFSKSGFTDACRQKAKEMGNVHLVTFLEMIEAVNEMGDDDEELW